MWGTCRHEFNITLKVCSIYCHHCRRRRHGTVENRHLVLLAAPNVHDWSHGHRETSWMALHHLNHGLPVITPSSYNTCSHLEPCTWPVIVGRQFSSFCQPSRQRWATCRLPTWTDTDGGQHRSLFWCYVCQPTRRPVCQGCRHCVLYVVIIKDKDIAMKPVNVEIIQDKIQHYKIPNNMNCIHVIVTQ